MEYCKNACHVDQFLVKILYRKEAVVRQYFQTYNLIEKYNALGEFYQDNGFARIDAVWGAKIANLNTMIQAIPETAKDNSIGYSKHALGKFFKIDDIEMTKEQKLIEKEIDEIAFLKQANAETLRFINLREDMETVNNELIKILQKVMAL